MLRLFLLKFFSEQKYQNIIQQVLGPADLPCTRMELIQTGGASARPERKMGPDQAGSYYTGVPGRFPADVFF